MRKYKIVYLDSSLIKQEEMVSASCEELALIVFSNKHSQYKILSVEEK